MTDASEVMRAFERMAVGGGARGAARRLDPPPIPGDVDERAWDLMRQPGWVSATRMGRLAFVRECPACKTIVPPREGWRARPEWYRYTILSPAEGPDQVMPGWAAPQRCDVCPRCSAPFSGPPMLARARDEPKELVLSLAVPGRCELRSMLSRWMLDEAAVDIVQHRWLMMAEAITDRLTYSESCAARGCSAQGRQHLEVYDEVVFASHREDGTELWHTLPPGKTWLCPMHWSQLRAAMDHRSRRPILQGGPW